jgi:sorting nexin-29
MPEDWNISVICPIYKKGDKLQCTNYRGISLLNICYKIFTSLLYEWLVLHMEEILGDYQCGFRRGRSMIDNLSMLRIICEKFYEYDLELHLLFLDFKQAYDSVDRRFLYNTLKEFGIPNKLVSLIKMTLENSKSKL